MTPEALAHSLEGARLAWLDDAEQRLASSLSGEPQARGRGADQRREGVLLGLRQVLVNLVDNAIKYGTHGGAVTTTARTDGNRTVICVRDDGGGIDASHLARLFERFYRVDVGRSREKGGAGLGLAIVKHLVESMGGSVRVESVLGAGTTFTVELPANCRQSASRSDDAVPPTCWNDPPRTRESRARGKRRFGSFESAGPVVEARPAPHPSGRAAPSVYPLSPCPFVASAVGILAARASRRKRSEADWFFAIQRTPLPGD